jgi:hypothetical protein
MQSGSAGWQVDRRVNAIVQQGSQGTYVFVVQVGINCGVHQLVSPKWISCAEWVGGVPRPPYIVLLMGGGTLCSSSSSSLQRHVSL